MANKELERQVIERLRSVYTPFPAGKIVDSESPDFIIQQENADCLGIEATDMVEESGRHTEEVHQEVARLARQAFEQRRPTPVLVYVQWKENVRLRQRSDKNKIAEQLATLVEAMLPAPIPQQPTTIEADPDDLRHYGLDQFLFSVRVTCYERKRTNEWFVTESGFIYSEPDDFQDAIDGKEAKLGSYKQKCQTVWLLIYFLSHRLSGSVELTDDVLEHRYRSGFDRVIVFDFYANRAAELRKA